MTGYCSNSPLRCSNAMSMMVLNQLDDCCPECGLTLIEDSSQDNSSHIELRILQFGLCIVVLLLLTLIFIYYTKFV